MGYLGDYDFEKEYGGGKKDFGAGSKETGKRDYNLGTDYNKEFEKLGNFGKSENDKLGSSDAGSKYNSGYANFLDIIEKWDDMELALGGKIEFGIKSLKLEVAASSENGLNLNFRSSTSTGGMPELTGGIYVSAGRPAETGTQCTVIGSVEAFGFEVEVEGEKITLGREWGVGKAYGSEIKLECENTIRIGIDSPNGQHDKTWEFKPIPDILPRMP